MGRLGRRFTHSSVRPLFEPMIMWASHKISTGRLVEIFNEWDNGAESFALPLSETERVKRLVQNSNGLTSGEIAEATGLGRQAVQFKLVRLARRGHVHATGKRPFVWRGGSGR